MPREIEAKFRVENFSSVRRSLKRIGATHMETILQTDSFFDTPDGSLRSADCGLRIRRVRVLRSGSRKSDTRPLVTYKGPRDLGEKTKSRLEFQTHVDNIEAIFRILEGCGMNLAMTIQKKRSSYRAGECFVELDELPLIGRFVEIEGPDESAIGAVRRDLRLGDDPIIDSYLSLVTDFCRLTDSECQAVTFDNCRNCQRRN